MQVQPDAEVPEDAESSDPRSGDRSPMRMATVVIDPATRKDPPSGLWLRLGVGSAHSETAMLKRKTMG
jgi:hypothetical protein